MFVDLVPLLALDDRRLPTGQFIFITDTAIDGNFLLHHFLSMYLRGALAADFCVFVFGILIGLPCLGRKGLL